MRILIVDDDLHRCDGLVHFLSAMPDQAFSAIEVASCIDEAKALLRVNYYDAMVLDVVLPKRKGERAASSNSLGLLSQLARQSFLKKPEKIIAITAHEDEIESFRSSFEEFCTVVVRAHDPSDAWRASIGDSLRYTSFSQISRSTVQRDVAVFTIHGIRTYGAWQTRLQSLIETRTDNVSFYTYKYGYFSVLSFLVPWLRKVEVSRLYQRLTPLVDQVAEARVVIFAHSFGTYLAAHTLQRVLSISTVSAEICLVCSGSVLDENFDWNFARKHANVRVVNDCGSSDYVLYLSKVLALGLGMAGKIGFNGFNDPRFVNRWFVGGHGHYFYGDRFMLENWLPLIAGTKANCVDFRSEPAAWEAGLDGVVRGVGRLKFLVYGLLAVSAVALIWGSVA